jgi:hypothetical protein
MCVGEGERGIMLSPNHDRVHATASAAAQLDLDAPDLNRAGLPVRGSLRLVIVLARRADAERAAPARARRRAHGLVKFGLREREQRAVRHERHERPGQPVYTSDNDTSSSSGHVQCPGHDERRLLCGDEAEVHAAGKREDLQAVSMRSSSERREKQHARRRTSGRR